MCFLCSKETFLQVFLLIRIIEEFGIHLLFLAEMLKCRAVLLVVSGQENKKTDDTEFFKNAHCEQNSEENSKAIN